MNKKEYFIDEFVIGLGFLSGLWIAAGINPEAEVFKALGTIINILSSNSGFDTLFFILPTLIFIVSIIGLYSMGGKFGLFAVVGGFIGGLLILVSPIFSMILLFAGMLIGKIAIDETVGTDLPPI